DPRASLARALEEGAPDLRLEARHGVAQRRLRYVEPGGCPGQVPFVEHRQEVGEITQFHVRSVPRGSGVRSWIGGTSPRLRAPGDSPESPTFDPPRRAGKL